jgi:hypothetical protein
MRSALEIVAFSQGNKSLGVLALLDVALKALDEEGMPVIAIHVDLALALLHRVLEEHVMQLEGRRMPRKWRQFVH